MTVEVREIIFLATICREKIKIQTFGSNAFYSHTADIVYLILIDNENLLKKQFYVPYYFLGHSDIKSQELRCATISYDLRKNIFAYLFSVDNITS